MSDDHTIRAASLEAKLSTVQMDIDDDDEDVVLVSIDMTNEAAIPLGGLEVHIVTSDGKKVASDSGISSLGPGLTRNFSFEFPLEKGTIALCNVIIASLTRWKSFFSKLKRRSR